MNGVTIANGQKTRRKLMFSLLTLSFVLIIPLSLVLVGCGGSTSTTQQRNTGLKHIFYIMMENHSTNEIIGNTNDAPYINQLANQFRVAMSYFGVTHPSLPNYLAAISGDFQGIWDDCKAGALVTCKPEAFVSGPPYNDLLLTQDEVTSATNKPHMFSGQNIVDQLESHQLTWKAYMQSMPSVGFTGEYYPVDTDAKGNPVPRKLYAIKHNPFMYFSDIRNNPARMQKIVPFTQFDQDIKSSNVPNFVWISPNQCNDMHGVSPDSGMDHSVITRGDNFIKTIVPQIMSSPAWNEGSAIVIVWDENDFSAFSGCCHSPVGVRDTVLGGANAPLIVITSSGPHHLVVSDTSYNHYVLLAPIEKLCGLPCLANACGFNDAVLMTRFFGED